MVIRRSININLGPEEILALRKILLDEGQTMADFFAECARKHIAQAHKRQQFLPAARSAPKPQK